MVESRLSRALLCLALLLPLAAEARIERSAAEVLAFKRANPCPSTGQRRGSCPGHVVDHVIPLCAGGPDKVSNMQWQTVADAKAKDREERRLCRKP
ncbi:MAG: HNH endonuclease signature motif containing protein [Anaerolineales bacterium]